MTFIMSCTWSPLVAQSSELLRNALHKPFPPSPKVPVAKASKSGLIQASDLKSYLGPKVWLKVKAKVGVGWSGITKHV